jgi:hypothetical protein
MAVESGILPGAFHFVSIKLICCLSCCPLRGGSQERNCVPVNILAHLSDDPSTGCQPLDGQHPIRSCRDGKSGQPARPWSRQLIPATGMFSSTAQTSPHIPGKAPATPHAPAARETSPILRHQESKKKASHEVQPKAGNKSKNGS